MKRFGLIEKQDVSHAVRSVLLRSTELYSLDRAKTVNKVLSINIHSEREKDQVHLLDVGHELYRLPQDLGSSWIGNRSTDLNPVTKMPTRQL